MADRSKKQNVEKLIIKGQALYEMGTAVEEVFSKLGSKITETVDKANALRIGFQQSFGLFQAEKGAELVRNLAEFNNEIKGLEISTEKLAKNFQQLGRDLNAYVYERSEQTLFSFSKMISLNEKFGITTGDSIRALNSLTTNFGMASKDAELFNNKLLEFATKTGQPFDKVFQQFNSSIKEFYTILDPTKAASQFTSFQQLARGLGGEISEFMKVATQFNTLESASKFGAELNNVLSVVGGSFDAMQASMLSYDDRIKYMIKSISDSRGQIMEMDDISRQAFIQQLSQTSQLSGQTIQAILNNQKLVDSVEGLTTQNNFGEMKGLGDDQLEKMAKDFTSLSDKSKLYMDQYLRLGIRLERFADAQTERMKDVQVKILSNANSMIFASKSVSDLLDRIQKQFSEENIKEKIKNAEKYFDQYVDKSIADTNRALGFVFSQNKTPVIQPKLPGVTTPPTGTRVVGQLEQGINLTESIQKGISSGIAEAASKIQAKELIITMKTNPILDSFVKVMVEEKKPTSAILGAGANKP